MTFLSQLLQSPLHPQHQINSNDDNTNSNSVVPTDIPDRPTDLKVNPILSTQIDLSWSPPENDSRDDNPITGYKIEVRTTNDFSHSTVIEDTESTDTTYSHTGLIPNTTYIYRVYAINDVGTSEPSDESLVNTLITDPQKDENDFSSTQNNNNTNNDANISSTSTDVPTQSIDLQATPISQNRIDLSWSAPIDGDLSPLLGYKIESKTSEESNYSILVTNTGNVSITSYSHTGLTAGLTYQYRVSAINSFGESVPSDMVEAKIVSSSNNVQLTDETQSQQSSPTLQPLQITINTDKAVYGPDESIEIFGTINNNSDQTVSLGLRVISSDDAIAYARSISISSDNSFDTIISSLQRQSSAWQIDGEFTVEVMYNGRIQTTTTFMNDNAGNPLSNSNESSNDISESSEQKFTQSSSETSSTNDLVISNNELESLKNQNNGLQSANQQLHDENNQLKIQIEDLNKKIENLDLIVQEQIRVMSEVLGLS